MSESAPAKRWFYVRDGRRHGPVDARDVIDHILAGDIAEDALVWHSGLPEWQPAREVEGIREELPPPVPVPAAPAPPEPVSDDDDEDGEDDDGEDGADDDDEGTEAGVSKDTAGEGPEAGGDAAEGEVLRRRRRRKRTVHHHRPARRTPPWLVPLVVVLVALMIGLWWLLRRMNEVPPGTIIQTGALAGGESGYRVALGREPSTTVSPTSWPDRFTTIATSSPGLCSPSAYV
jgi:hypothetical protein